MADNSDQWVQSSSGSGAYDQWNIEWNTTYQTEDNWYYANTAQDQSDQALESRDYDDAVDKEDEEYMAMAAGNTFGNELPPGQLMSTKVPPAWDGTGSWFNFEELVMDWQDITVLSEDKQGPALRNRLLGEAAVYTPMLDRDKLKN